MTITIKKNKLENSVEIWADYGQHQKYCYTAQVNTYSKEDFAEHIKWADYDNSDIVEEFKKIIDLFAEADRDYIYRCDATSGHDDYCEYFATHEEAMDDCENQTC